MTGRGNPDSSRAHLKPIYEGYFSKIFWKETNETTSKAPGNFPHKFYMSNYYGLQFVEMKWLWYLDQEFYVQWCLTTSLNYVVPPQTGNSGSLGTKLN